MSEAPDYYIGLQNTVTIRKGLLEAAKQSVILLKAQYHLREVREQKQLRMKQIMQHLSIANKLVIELDASLPEHNREHMPEAVRKAAQRIEQRQKAHNQERSHPVTIPEPKVFSQPISEKKDVDKELQALESKLSDIESKLNKL